MTHFTNVPSWDFIKLAKFLLGNILKGFLNRVILELVQKWFWWKKSNTFWLNIGQLYKDY